MTERVHIPVLHPGRAGRQTPGKPVRPMERVTACASQLAADVRGSGDAIEFIHGLGAAATFAPGVEELACAGTPRLIIYSRRGYGG